MVIYVDEKEKVCANCEHFMPCMVQRKSRKMAGSMGVCDINKMALNAMAMKCKLWDKRKA